MSSNCSQNGRLSLIPAMASMRTGALRSATVLGRRDHDGRRPVHGHVAVEQADRGGDHPGLHVVVHRQRRAVHGIGIEAGVGPLRHRDPRQLLAPDAIVVHVASRERGDLAYR